MIQPYSIGIDLGTSACRVIVIDEFEQICAEVRSELPAPIVSGAIVEQSPQFWWDAVWHCLKELSAQIDLQTVQGLAVDGTSATVLISDAQGQPLGPAIMYADCRSQEEAAQIRAIAPRQSGAHGASSSLSKLLYLIKCYPKGRYVLHQADWIANRLCGRWGLTDENNALKLGYDPVQRCWPDWFSQLDVPWAWLPRVQAPGSLFGYLQNDFAQQLQLPQNLPIIAGTTDSTAAFLASGATQPGEAMTVLGSTLVIKMISEKPLFAPDYGIYSHRLNDLWLVGGASNSGGAVLLQYFTPKQLAAMTPLLEPEKPTGLDYYPLSQPGERFPINDPNWLPRLTPRPENDVRFFQGLLEGLARIESQGYQLLQKLGAPPLRSVRTTGGGAVNLPWQFIRQQQLQVPLIAAQQTEAAYGSAGLVKRHHLIIEADI